MLDGSLLQDLEDIPITDDSPGCVLVGNLGEGFTYERLDAAFRHLMAGADLIALSKNRNWQTAGGEFCLGAGPFVAALEYASGKRATCVGKPPSTTDRPSPKLRHRVSASNVLEESTPLQATSQRVILCRDGRTHTHKADEVLHQGRLSFQVRSRGPGVRTQRARAGSGRRLPERYGDP
jgi:hypothetical protein